MHSIPVIRNYCSYIMSDAAVAFKLGSWINLD